MIRQPSKQQRKQAFLERLGMLESLEPVTSSTGGWERVERAAKNLFIKESKKGHVWIPFSPKFAEFSIRYWGLGREPMTVREIISEMYGQNTSIKSKASYISLGVRAGISRLNLPENRHRLWYDSL
jgi:hypothetical protein